MNQEKIKFKQPVVTVQKIIKGICLFALLIIILGLGIAVIVEPKIGLTVSIVGLLVYMPIILIVGTFPSITGFTIDVQKERILLSQGISKNAENLGITFADIQKMYRVPHDSVISKKKYWTEGDTEFWGVRGTEDVLVIHYINGFFGENKILQVWLAEIDQLEELIYQRAPQLERTESEKQVEIVLLNRTKITQQSGVLLPWVVFGVIMLIILGGYVKVLMDFGYDSAGLKGVGFIVIVFSVFYYMFAIKTKKFNAFIYNDRISISHGIGSTTTIEFTEKMILSKGIFEKNVTKEQKRIGIKRGAESLEFIRPEVEDEEERSIILGCVDAAIIKSEIEKRIKINQ